MYRLGQTSSTGVSPTGQESKMTSSSLMSSRSCSCLLLDILPGRRLLLQHTPALLWLSVPTVPLPTEVYSSVRGMSRWLFERCLAPKLALCVQCALGLSGCSYLML